MRRTTYRQEEWSELQTIAAAPLPLLMSFPGDVAAAAPGDEYRFPGDLRIKVVAIDTQSRCGSLSVSVGVGPHDECPLVSMIPIRRRTIEPLRLSRGMRRHIRRMKAARP